MVEVLEIMDMARKDMRFLELDQLFLYGIQITQRAVHRSMGAKDYEFVRLVGNVGNVLLEPVYLFPVEPFPVLDGGSRVIPSEVDVVQHHEMRVTDVEGEVGRAEILHEVICALDVRSVRNYHVIMVAYGIEERHRAARSAESGIDAPHGSGHIGTVPELVSEPDSDYGSGVARCFQLIYSFLDIRNGAGDKIVEVGFGFNVGIGNGDKRKA